MDCRGQGAMEYLMSYGWAILVILVVGVTLWQLGVLNVGTSVPPTSSGFPTLKPILPTCKGVHQIWETGMEGRGFSCLFANTDTDEIRLTDIDMLVNGQVCDLIVAQDNHLGQAPRTFLMKDCGSEDPTTCPPVFCLSERTPGVWNPCGWVPIEPGGTFTTAIYHWASWPGTDFGPCGRGYSPGAAYDVEISVEYRVTVGGIESTKRSSGTVRLVGD